MRSGVHAALSACALVRGREAPALPKEMAFGALIAHATNPDTIDYQPMHVNFGVLPPLDPPIRNKRDRYAAYAARGERALSEYRSALEDAGLIGGM